jgi:hypothetical protein
MVHAEIVVDYFAAAKAFLQPMPVADGRFAQLPAQIDFLAAVERSEVNQPDIEILKLASERMNPLYGVLQPASGRIPAPVAFFHFGPVDQGAAAQKYAVRFGLYRRIRLLVLALQLDGVAYGFANFRQKRFGFPNRKVLLHAQLQTPET